MSSFRQSRSRIFFDTVCAFGMSTFCAVAWTQIDATAMLGAAAVAGIYGLMRFTDMFQRSPVADQGAVEEPAIEVEQIAIEPEPMTPAVERKPVDLAGPTPELKPEVVAALVRKPKRKPARKPAKIAAPVEQTAADEPASVGQPSAEPEQPRAIESESDYSAPIAPLFEPEPFVRQQQRAAFGRKFGTR